MDTWADVWEEEEEEEEKEGECWGEEDGYLVIKYDKGGKIMSVCSADIARCIL